MVYVLKEAIRVKEIETYRFAQIPNWLNYSLGFMMIVFYVWRFLTKSATHSGLNLIRESQHYM